jgi:hypothetical protein
MEVAESLGEYEAPDALREELRRQDAMPDDDHYFEDDE